MPVRRFGLWCCVCAVLTQGTLAFADVRPLLPGEQTIYQTVRPGSALAPSTYRTFFSQITGNAFSEEGDEIRVDANTTARRVTNIAIATQTNNSSQQVEYTPAWVEATIYINDGAPDLAGDTPFNDASPHGQLSPSTVLARVRIPGISYPAGGVSRNDTNFVLNFPFNNVLVPAVFTVAIVNLDTNFQPDITYGVGPGSVNPDLTKQPGSYHFGTFQSTFVVGTPFDPAPGPDPEFNNTNYNSNPVGTSRTGPNINRFTNPGLWNWVEYPGKSNPLTIWESDRNSNAGMEMTIYAVVPEPSSLALCIMALCGICLHAGPLSYRRTRPPGTPLPKPQSACGLPR